jgi:hypothetical protein
MVSSTVLPPPHRQRWREESLAVLLAVRGARRWRYALDTIVKAPLLASQHRRGAPDTGPGPWVGAVAAVGLLGIPFLMLAGLLAAESNEKAGEFFFLTASCGMLPTVAVHSWRSARRHGGGPARYALALLVTLFAGTGPISAAMLADATNAAAIGIAGSLLPGGWLTVACGYALYEGRAPVALAVLGGVAGIALTGVLFSVELSMLELGLASTLIAIPSGLVLIPTFFAWSIWTGIRILRGRREFLAG